jgi:hypothetical protein
MSVSLCCCVCYVSALRIADPPSRESYRLSIELRNSKSGQDPTKGCRTIDEWMNMLKLVLPTIYFKHFNSRYVGTKGQQITGSSLNPDMFESRSVHITWFLKLNFELLSKHEKNTKIMGGSSCVVPTSGPTDSLCRLPCRLLAYSCSLINISWRGNWNRAGNKQTALSLLPTSQSLRLNLSD